MRAQDMVKVDGLIRGTAGLVAKIAPGKYDELFPWWEGRGNGLATLVSYQGRPFLATRLTDDLVVLTEVEIRVGEG